MRLDLSRPSIGSWCQIGHAAIADIVARAGFSWLAADCEHGEFDDLHIADFCRVVHAHGCVALVRVRENAVLPIRRALDLGADGVIVPMINTGEEAMAAVQAAYYPPRGIRGFAWQAANGYGAEFQSYIENFRPLVVAMVESALAVDNVEDIMQVEGIDACLMGPYDLSGSYGIPGQVSHPRIQAAAAKIAAACLQCSKAAGQHLVSPTKETVRLALEQHFNFLALGMDTQFLGRGAREALALI